MKKILMMVAVAMMTAMSMGIVSCSDPEEGEDWATWEMRNMLDSRWSIDRVMVDGEWTFGVFWMDMKLKAEGRTFEATRFFYKDDEKDDATEVKKKRHLHHRPEKQHRGSHWQRWQKILPYGVERQSDIEHTLRHHVLRHQQDLRSNIKPYLVVKRSA